MSSYVQDIRQTFRNIANAPVFFGALILTLAIGIGANTAIFSIVKTVLLDPLPYPNADQIISIADNPWVPVEIYDDLKASTGGSFEEVAAFYPQPYAVTGSDQPMEVEGARVTPNFFRIFRVGVSQGRGFTPEDAVPGAPGTVVVSQGFWQYRYGGSSDAANRSLPLNGVPHQVTGMLDRSFRQITPGAKNPVLWIAAQFEPLRADGSPAYAIPIIRLKDGASLQQAQAELKVVVARFLDRRPDFRENSGWASLKFAPIKDELVGNIRPALLILQFAVGILLLIACVNVANLLQARFSSRQRELAVRASLGATKSRLVRQLLTESVVLGVLGGLAGFILMLLSLKLIVAAAPQDIPRIDQVSSDFGVFVFSLGISVIAGLLFGVFPATVTTRRTLYDHLKEGGRSPGRSRGQNRISQALVITEITLTLVLLVGAGLLVRSFFALTSQTLGFRTDDVAVVAISTPENRYTTVPELEEFYRQARERIAAVPGVEAVGVSNNLPIKRGRSSREIIVEGRTEAKTYQYGVVSPGYFSALAIPLLRGRDIEDADRRTSPAVAIVDEAMATAVWPNEDALGKRFRMSEDQNWITVIGVAANSRGNGLAKSSSPGFYISNQQRRETLIELSVGRQAVFLILSRTGMDTLAPALRRAIWDVDAQQPIPEITTLQRVMGNEGGPQRFRAVLLGAFAVIALVLVIAGIYGIVEYLVGERTHELGIRKVMGATDGDIIRRILAWGWRLAAIGIVIGLLGVFALNRYLASLLFGVGAMDPWTIAGAITLIVLITTVACYLPARRVALVDPIIALRAEGRAQSAGTRKLSPAGGAG